MERSAFLVRVCVVLLVFFAVAAAAVGVTACFFMERVAVLAVNSFTGYRISYSEWKGHLLGKNDIEGLVFEVKDRNIQVKAKTSKLDINVKESMAKKAIILDVSLENVEIIGLIGEKAGMELANNVLSIPFSAGHVYDSISFHVSAGEQVFALTGFKALADDARIEGDFTYSRDRQEVDMDVKISFSPAMADKLPGDIKERVLSLDADGWYSTVIDYKGNVVFLKALYSLAS